MLHASPDLGKVEVLFNGEEKLDEFDYNFPAGECLSRRAFNDRRAPRGRAAPLGRIAEIHPDCAILVLCGIERPEACLIVARRCGAPGAPLIVQYNSSFGTIEKAPHAAEAGNPRLPSCGSLAYDRMSG